MQRETLASLRKNSKWNGVICWTDFILHLLGWFSHLARHAGKEMDPICAITVQEGWCVDHSVMIKITHIFFKLHQLKSCFLFLSFLCYLKPIIVINWSVGMSPLKQCTAIRLKCCCYLQSTFYGSQRSNDTDRAHTVCVQWEACLVPHTLYIKLWNEAK